MCNFSLDGTQAKGYSSYSPLSLSLLLFLPLFWVVSMLAPALPPSSPLHAPWCLHFITTPPSINLSHFVLRSDFPHTQFWIEALHLRMCICPMVPTNCVCVFSGSVCTCAPAWLWVLGYKCVTDHFSMSLCTCVPGFLIYVCIFAASSHLSIFTYNFAHATHIQYPLMHICGILSMSWMLLFVSSWTSPTSALVSVRWAVWSCAD